jgi:hypothetical protein
MRRFISTVAFAAACAFSIHVSAQETTIKSKTSAEHGKARTVTYTGCINSGTETRTYILEKSVPISRTETRGTSGLTESVDTTYALVPEGQVQFQEHVGQRVEVTGILVPAGKSTTKTKIEREHGKDETSKVKSDSNLPQFRVVSIRPLGESCR